MNAANQLLHPFYPSLIQGKACRREQLSKDERGKSIDTI